MPVFEGEKSAAIGLGRIWCLGVGSKKGTISGEEKDNAEALRTLRFAEKKKA
jgi:hypothetical protein